MNFYFGLSNGALKWATNYVPKTSSNHQIKTGSILWTDFRLFFDRVKTDSRSFGSIGPKIVQITSTIHMALNHQWTWLNNWGYFGQIYLFRWPSTARWLKVMYRGLSFVPTFKAQLMDAWITTTYHPNEISFEPWLDLSIRFFLSCAADR